MNETAAVLLYVIRFAKGTFSCANVDLFFELFIFNHKYLSGNFIKREESLQINFMALYH